MTVPAGSRFHHLRLVPAGVMACAVVLLLAGCGLFGLNLGADGIDASWVTIAGQDGRRAIVATPDDHVTESIRDRRLPLVVVLHGLDQTAEDIARSTEWPSRAADDNFIAVFPQGEDDSWNAGGCCGKAAENHVDDMAFLDATIAQLVSEEGADGDRVYMTGFSNGAMMTYRYACERPDALAGAASVAGTNFSDCVPTEDIPFLQISGRDDPVIPVLGGESSVPGVPKVPSVEESILAVAEGAGCGEPTSTRIKSVQTFQATGCSNGVTVRYDVIDGLGHHYPTGDNSPAYVAVDQIIEFWGLGRRES